MSTDELAARLGEGEFFVNGDTFDLIWRPGPEPRNYAGEDKIVARMACGETAHWLPGVVAMLLNTALHAPAPDQELVERVARAMQEAELNDGDEGNTYRLFDLLDLSGENKAHMIVNQLARAAIAALSTGSPRAG